MLMVTCLAMLNCAVFCSLVNRKWMFLHFKISMLNSKVSVLF